jgi:predicted MFS family arabinose efflux permease
VPPFVHRPHARPARPPGGLGERDFLLLLAATAGAFSNYAPMLSVVPLWSAGGGTGPAGVGAATGVTMATTVAVQTCMPWLLRRLSLRVLFAVGAVLLGVPTVGYVATSDLGWVLAVSAVRGVGFGMVAVAGSALVAELVVAERRGTAVGWYGVAVGLPQVVCLPLAVWWAQQGGFTGVFVVTAVLSVLAAPLVLAIAPHVHGPVRPGERRPVVDQLRPMLNPWVVLLTAACALGGLTSFLPLALTEGAVAATALFVLSAAAITGRWGAGWLSDRLGVGRLLVPSVVACAVGVLAFAAAVTAGPASTAVAMAAAVVYGFGFGALQNDTLVVMFARARPGGNGTASTVWNMAFDAGTGAGAVATGLVAAALSISGAFTVAALVVLAAVPSAWLSAAAARRVSGLPHSR